MLETVKDNPIPSLIAGLSIGWLVTKGSRSGVHPEGQPARYYDYNQEAGFGERSAQHYSGGSDQSSASSRAREQADQARETAREYGQRVQQYGQQAQHRAEQTARGMQRRARRSVSQAERIIEENPLGAGIASLALGAFAGLMVPSTRREDKLMGETRDRVVHEAKETARETTERAKHVAKKTAEEAQKTAKEEARRQKEKGESSSTH